MNQLTFAVLVLLPSAALCFVILSTFYGWVKAYLAISWIPLALFLVIHMFYQMEYLPGSQGSRVLLLEAVSWTSLLQGLPGLALVVRALAKGEDWAIPALATMITILPFFLAH